MIFLAIKRTLVTGIVPKAKKYVFSWLKKRNSQNEYIFPIFKVEQHIIALASRKVTYSKFKFDIIVFLNMVLVLDISSPCFHTNLKVLYFAQLEGKQRYFSHPIEPVWVRFPKG